jgi:hypothetical protein
LANSRPFALVGSVGRTRGWAKSGYDELTVRNLAAPVLALVLAVLAVAGCATLPAPSEGPPASLDDPATGLIPPPGEAVRIDNAKLSEDGAAVTLTFVGGKEYDPRDPCTNRYFGWAHEADGTLDVKVVNDTPPSAAGGAAVACDAMGYTRTVTVKLETPFLGNRVHDLAGYIHFARRPDGLVELAKLPSDWKLVTESDVQESPTGRWQRTWTMGGLQPNGQSKGKVDLYQAFDGPASVTGGDEVHPAQVNGAAATLYRSAPDGELVLVWELGDDGLALVVNETDFSGDKAIELAESATIP